MLCSLYTRSCLPASLHCSHVPLHSLLPACLADVKWMHEGMQVSTKGDLANATVVTTEAQQVADAAGVELISTSALNNQNVTSLFHRLGEDIYARRHPSTSQS